MGLNRNSIMENTKKVILFILIVLTLPSCVGQKKDAIKNKSFIVHDTLGAFLFKMPNYNKLSNSQEEEYYIKNDSVFYSYIYDINDDKSKKISDVIDPSSFDVLYNDEKDKINNEYYRSNPILTYFKDKKNIYVYQYLYSKPKFYKVANSDEYTILGGAYVQIKDKIYWYGEELKGVDLDTFETVNVSKSNSEWESTIGMDKNHLYSGQLIMNFKQFDTKFFWDNKEELKKRYFFSKK